MDRFWLAFIPLFVAFDIVGLLPVFWGLSQHIPAAERREAVHQAVVAALVVTLAFLWISGWIFQAMGIIIADVMIAGGVILFGLALSDLLHPEKAPGPTEAIGIVPLGIPLIAGPAVLTTVLLTRQRYGLWPTVWALSLNIILTWVVLLMAGWLMERLGRIGARVISKVSSLVLAAFAVMLIRQGVLSIFD